MFKAPTTFLRLTLGILLLALLLTMMLTGTAIPSLYLALVSEFPAIALWLTAAIGYGHLTSGWILPRTPHPSPANPSTPHTSTPHTGTPHTGTPHAPMILGLGLGIVSLLTLLVGSLKLLSPVSSYLILLPGSCYALFLVYHHQTALSNHLRDFFRSPAGTFTALLPLSVPLGLLLFACLLPPGMLWSDDPHPYDVISYHFQLPREFLTTGSTAPLKHNVFSHFPLLAEMHFALMFGLKGGPYAGMYAAQLTSALHAILTAAAIFQLARNLFPAKAAISALLSAATCPFLLMLGSVGYVESHLVLYTTLTLTSITAALLTPASDRRTTLRHFIAAGLFAGFAASAKLTAVPLLLILLPASLILILRTKVLPLAAPIAAYILVALLTFSPWLVRSYSATGNPVFPLATAVFGRAHFSPQQVERWQAAHSPRPDQQTLSARAHALYTDLLANDRFAFLLAPVALLGALMTLRRSAILQWLTLFAILQLTFWLFFTHLQGRFLITLLPILAILVSATTAASINTNALRKGLIIVRTALYVVGLAVLFTRLARPIGLSWQQRLLYTPSLFWLTPEVLATYDPQSPLLLLGDVRPFLYDRPNLIYATVFDLPPGEITSSFRRAVSPLPPATLELVTPSELARLSSTYRHLTYNPPPDPTPFVQPTSSP